MDVLIFLWRALRVLGRLCFKLSRWALRAVVWLLRKAFSKPSATFGSARWAGWWDVFRAGAWGGTGLIVGKAWGRFLRFKGEGALLVFAPQGSGKGTGIVVPNLLTHPGAIICTDPKGENYGITQRYRRTLGPVYRLDAIDPETSDSFNPLDMVRVGSAYEHDDALMVADLLVTPEASESHWDTSAKNLIAAFMVHVLRTCPPPLRTLATVRELMAAEEHTLQSTLMAMATSAAPSVAEEARSALAAFDQAEFIAVVRNATKALALWSKDRIGGRLSATSDFDLMDVHRGTFTLYIMVPEEMLSAFAPILRVVMGCAVAAMVRGKHLPRPQYKPLLLFDECQALGRLEALRAGLGYLREYARMVLIFQDLGRLTEHYGETGARTFMAASGAQVAFRVSDNQTASYLADAIGMATVPTRSSGMSQANTDLFRRQEQEGQGEAGRYLIDPGEIRRLPESRALVLMSTVKAPIKARKLRYYRVRQWRRRWDAWRDRAPAAQGLQDDHASGFRGAPQSPRQPQRPLAEINQADHSGASGH